MIGKSLKHYKILEKIGAGGMGEVYLAEDTTLNRKIALKVLPPEMASSADRLGRFEREAKAVAALNHPNIVTIHSIEKSDALHFLTMELVSGKPLGQLIPKGGFDLGRLLDFGLAMSEAMTAAHEKNITHRDLKPDNIMVSDDGRLKILDFGLAKLKEEAQPASHGTELPTQAVRTEDGRILGTVAYMAPEQAEGKPVDPRSDVFSMGVLLYEMATGERPFTGDSRISIISSIMRDTPTSITELNRTLPRQLGRIIKRCLAKDPDRRYGNAKELYNELLELKEEFDSGELHAPGGLSLPASRRKAVPWLAAAVIVSLAAALVFVLLRQTGSPPDSAPPPLEATFTRLTDRVGLELNPSLSPDGKVLIFSSMATGNWDIYMQRVEGEKIVNLTADSPVHDYHPQFSPDGERIVFRSDRDGGGIFVMGGMGESVTRLTEGGFNPVWSPDGREVLYSTQGAFDPRNRGNPGQLIAVKVDTRETRRIFDEADAVHPSWSPNGHRIAFWGLREGSGQRDIWTIPAAGGEPVAVTEDIATDWSPVWSPDGGFLYFSSDRSGSFNLWRVPIDEETGVVTGELQPVTTGAADSGPLTISVDGRRIAYVEDRSSNNLQKIRFDPEGGEFVGEPEWLTRGSVIMYSVDVSPDGEWIAYYPNALKEDLFLARIDGSGRRQLTDDIHKDRDPAWSPDGKQIAFFSDRSGSYEVWTIQTDGRGLRQLTDVPEGWTSSPWWSPDGSRLGVYFDNTFSFIDPDLPSGEQEPEPLPAWDGKDGTFGVEAWSRDSRLLAGAFFSQPDEQNRYEGFGIYSLETGKHEILLERDDFPLIDFSAVWLAAGRRLIFSYESRVYLLDRETRKYRKIFDADRDNVTVTWLSPDDRTLYWMRFTGEGDIWMLELE